jgi:hypothetical protein
MITRAIATTQPAVVLIIAAAAIGICSCTKGPKGLSNDTYAGVKKTVAAMRRANEYRDSGVLLFEPRFLDLERAVDGIATPRAYSEITTASDLSAAEIARSCVHILRSYRQMLDLAPSSGDTGILGPGIRGTLRQEAVRAHLEEYQEHLTGMRKSLDDCVIQLGGYL